MRMFKKPLSLLFALFISLSSNIVLAGETNFILLDQNGNKIEDSAFRGKVMMVYFGFSHHGEDCTQALKKMGDVLSQLGENSKVIQPIFISLDSNHDTPKKLKEFMKSFDSRIIGLNGNKTTGAAEITDHERSYFFHDREGIFVGNIASESPVSEIAGAVKEFIEQNSGNKI